jgi:hypothetical protein
MTYEEKLKIANEYLNGICGVEWDDLGDTNSLHDADDEEGIKELCNERLEQNGFPID